MSDLHMRIKEEIERRKAVAEAVDRNYWSEFPIPNHHASEFADFHTPADALRRYERDLRVLTRHAPEDVRDMLWCKGCDHDCCSLPWPCVEVRDLAASLGIPVGPNDE